MAALEFQFSYILALFTMILFFFRVFKLPHTRSRPKLPRPRRCVPVRCSFAHVWWWWLFAFFHSTHSRLSLTLFREMVSDHDHREEKEKKLKNEIIRHDREMMRARNSFPQLSTIPTSMRLLRHISVKSFVDKWHKREVFLVKNEMKNLLPKHTILFLYDFRRIPFSVGLFFLYTTKHEDPPRRSLEWKKCRRAQKPFFLFLFSAKHKRHPLQVLFIPPFCCSFFTTLTQQLCAALLGKGIVSKEKKYLFGFSSFHPLIYDCGAHYMRSIEILKIKNIESFFFVSVLRRKEQRYMLDML